GLIKNLKTKGVTKIPILGDIPGLGWLFKSQKDTNAKSELIIFVSPTIINQQEVMRMEKKEKEGVGKWYQETEPQEDTPPKRPAADKKDTTKKSLVGNKGKAATNSSQLLKEEQDIAVSDGEAFQPQGIIYKSRESDDPEKARKVEKETISALKRKEMRSK
ncbi:MAG: hypothetical protein L6366_07860, partial [Candidatus Omnitrophica bacterium]|nr:hypothetical protein [Candidatus Omnitrophota bacterium]